MTAGRVTAQVIAVAGPLQAAIMQAAAVAVAKTGMVRQVALVILQATVPGV